MGAGIDNDTMSVGKAGKVKKDKKKKMNKHPT